MKNRVLKAISAVMLVIGIGFFNLFSPWTQSAYADPLVPAETEIVTDDSETTNDSEQYSIDEEPICQQKTDAIAWIVCSVVKVSGSLVDGFYNMIEQFLIVEPLATDQDSGIFKVWNIMRNLTNIVFVIFAIIVIYSQLTGLGISNYGIKRTLPRLIVAIILVNLSYFISSIAIDVSNIIGGSLMGMFNGIQEDILSDGTLANAIQSISWVDLTDALTVGSGAAILAVIGAGGLQSIFWAVVLALIGAVISLAIGLATIALRQGLVMVLVMISPIAFVAYLLPNTEKLFEKWKNLLFQMLVFYPMFSFLFGAAKLAGWAIIASADGNVVKLLIGLIVQVLPIFLSFSLFKMSGNVLGSVSAALHRASTAPRASLEGWATSHQERARMNYIAKSNMPGAHLRRFLDTQRAKRTYDTEKAAELRTNRALEKAYNHAASYHGLDEAGNDINGSRLPWRRGLPNASTQLSKMASTQATRTSAAMMNLENNLGDYDKTFNGQAASRISAMHAHAFEDTMRQQFRAKNIAQGDQTYLLNKYLDAAKDRDVAPFEFNRLIGGASSSLGHLGEASIIGQVIDGSVQIETRRRREAAVVFNKFGYSKTDFRGMTFDKAHINDDGYEEDAEGHIIEDSQYRLLPGKQHEGWGLYIGVHNRTGAEITKEQYDQLDEASRRNYKKVRYMEIPDDDHRGVQRVYEDDAGYMKEMIRQDIAIGDPINRRYLTEIGLARPDSQYSGTALDYLGLEKTGLLRKYHSTITAALLESKYAEHDAAVTAMLTAQANNGNITTIGQRNIAGLDSIWKAAKAGKFLINDATILNEWARILDSVNSTTPGETFDDFFSDADVALYRNVNGLALHGLRKVNLGDGNFKWEKVDRNDETLTVEEQKNWIKHRIIPAVSRKLLNAVDRTLTPNVLDNLKGDGTDALFNLKNVLIRNGAKDVDPETPFEERVGSSEFGDDLNILSARSPQGLKNEIREQKREIFDKYDLEVPGVNAPLNPNSSKQKRSQRKHRDGVPLGNSANNINNMLHRSNRRQDYLDQVNDLNSIYTDLNEIFSIGNVEADIVGDLNINTIGNAVLDYFDNNDLLRDYYGSAADIVERYTAGFNPNSTEEAINQLTDLDDQYAAQNLADMEQEINDLIDGISIDQ